MSLQYLSFLHSIPVAEHFFLSGFEIVRGPVGCLYLLIVYLYVLCDRVAEMSLSYSSHLHPGAEERRGVQGCEDLHRGSFCCLECAAWRVTLRSGSSIFTCAGQHWLVPLCGFIPVV